jgi:hypothetical protein
MGSDTGADRARPRRNIRRQIFAAGAGCAPETAGEDGTTGQRDAFMQKVATCLTGWGLVFLSARHKTPPEYDLCFFE